MERDACSCLHSIGSDHGFIAEGDNRKNIILSIFLVHKGFGISSFQNSTKGKGPTMTVRRREGSLVVERMEGTWEEEVTANHVMSDLLRGLAYCQFLQVFFSSVCP